MGCGKGAEDELLLEAEKVERAAALGRIERTEGMPTLRGHEVRLERLSRCGVAATCLSIGDRLFGEASCSAQIERANAVADLGIGVLEKPVAEFHQVAIGIVEGATFSVRHGEPPLASNSSLGLKASYWQLTKTSINLWPGWRPWNHRAGRVRSA